MSDRDILRAMVIEDEPSICILCKRVMAGLGYTVDVVRNGVEAERKVEEYTYDLIVCDIRLPEVSGIDFYIWLQQEHHATSKKVIFMTGSVMDGDTGNFLSKSGRPYITKPFRPDDLLNIINTFNHTGGE